MRAHQQFDVGGTPEQNAAVAAVMFAASAAPYSGNTEEERLHAAGIAADLLAAAEAGGFTAREEFLQLVGAGDLCRRLEQLGHEIVRHIGGAGKFFDLVDLITTTNDERQVPQ